jgi:hypothetical protein
MKSVFDDMVKDVKAKWGVYWECFGENIKQEIIRAEALKLVGELTNLAVQWKA